MKSHDYHVLLQQFLLLAVKYALPEDVSMVLAELSFILRQLCAKVLDRQELVDLQTRVVLMLCRMEMIFPPSFFTSQVHLIVHLVEEAKMGGPVHYRWMYPIERYLGKMKSFVRNRVASEGCIAECYVGDEVVAFVERYYGQNIRNERIPRVEDNLNYVNPISDTLFPPIGKPVGAAHFHQLSPAEMLQAHRHVLTRCTAVDSYRECVYIYYITF